MTRYIIATLALLIVAASPAEAQTTISSLTAASAANLTDVIPTDQCVGAGCTKKLTVAQLEVRIFADLVGGSGITASAGTIATASGETGFIGSGALTCGAGTAGRAQVHTTPLQYCSNEATPTLRYTAYADSSGKALDTPWAVNIRNPAYGATGNGSTDDTASIALAIIAAESTNRRLFIPCGTYQVAGSGSTMFTLTEPIVVYGEGPCSRITPATGVPTTRDIFTYDPGGTDIFTVAHPVFRDFRIFSEVANTARHGIVFRPGAAGEYITRFLVENVSFYYLNGFAVYIDGNDGVASGVWSGTIRHITAQGNGIGGEDLYDTIVCDSCNVHGTGYAVDVAFTPNVPGKFTLQNSNISTSSGVRIGGPVDGVTLFNNYFEPGVTFSGADNAYVNIVGVSSWPNLSPVVSWNMFKMFTAFGTQDALRINYANGAVIDNNLFVLESASADDIAITSNATSTTIGPGNRFYDYGSPPTARPGRIVNSGSATVGAEFSSARVVFTNSIRLDLEGGRFGEAYLRLPGSTTPPTTACNDADEAGTLYFDTDADTDGSVMVCRGAAGYKDIDDDGGAGGGAPTDAEYVVGVANGTLSAERVFQSGTNTTVATGAGTIQVNVADATTGAKGVVQLAGDLGGTAASPSVSDDSHNHTGTTISALDTADITTGTMATARLGSGTADSTTFLRGDQTYAVPAGGGSDPFGSPLLSDDFIGGRAVTGESQIGVLGWAPQGGTTPAYIASEVGHPGIVRISTPATGGSTPRAITLGVLNNTDVVDLDDVTSVEFWARCQQSTSVECRIGYIDDSSDSAGSGEAIYLEFDSAVNANWQCVTTAGGTRTKTASTTTQTNGLWVHGKVTKSGGSVSCYISTTASLGSAFATHSTNISGALVNIAAVVQTNEGVIKDLDVDIIEIGLDPTGR